MEDLWKNIHLASGYQLLYTPHIAKVRLSSHESVARRVLAAFRADPAAHQRSVGCGGPVQVDLWKTSGHFDFYRESMFNQMDVDAEEYQVPGKGGVIAGAGAGRYLRAARMDDDGTPHPLDALPRLRLPCSSSP